MRKTLPDVAGYLKEIMVPEMHEAYTINPEYTNVSLEESIREGILAFRAFFGSALRCFMRQRRCL